MTKTHRIWRREKNPQSIGSGVFVEESVVARAQAMQEAEPIVCSALDRLEALDLSEAEIRRLVENELAIRRTNTERHKRGA